MSRLIFIIFLIFRKLNIYYCLSRKFYYNLNPYISIGRGTIIEKGVTLSTQYGGRIIIGRNCILYRNSSLITHGNDIIMGDYSTVNPYTVIYGQGGCHIGNGVRIAALSTIVPSNHIFSDIETPIFKQGLSCKGITIEDDVWIGSGVRILDGITISKGCVIGAGSVVTKSTEPFGVYIGIPAKLLKKRT
jgi:acetyltransferase-like isoleucine patch superfamily enzyme